MQYKNAPSQAEALRLKMWKLSIIGKLYYIIKLSKLKGALTQRNGLSVYHVLY